VSKSTISLCFIGSSSMQAEGKAPKKTAGIKQAHREGKNIKEME
jgi:hypothetical protein